MRFITALCILAGITAAYSDQGSVLKAIAKNHDPVDLAPLADFMNRGQEWIMVEKTTFLQKAMIISTLPNVILDGIGTVVKSVEVIEEVLRAGKFCHKNGFDMTISIVQANDDGGGGGGNAIPTRHELK